MFHTSSGGKLDRSAMQGGSEVPYYNRLRQKWAFHNHIPML